MPCHAARSKGTTLPRPCSPLEGGRRPHLARHRRPRPTRRLYYPLAPPGRGSGCGSAEPRGQSTQGKRRRSRQRWPRVQRRAPPPPPPRLSAADAGAAGRRRRRRRRRLGRRRRRRGRARQIPGRCRQLAREMTPEWPSSAVAAYLLLSDYSLATADYSLATAYLLLLTCVSQLLISAQLLRCETRSPPAALPQAIPPPAAPQATPPLVRGGGASMIAPNAAAPLPPAAPPPQAAPPQAVPAQSALLRPGGPSVVCPATAGASAITLVRW